MSSVFNFSGFRSPPRRPIILPSPTSPFCTSPSQLEEATLDPDASLTYSMGVRSPNAPMRGRSIKEFEEHVNSLKKENFNLKLRIYFLEERMGTNFTLDQESAVKKNIELMVDIETLRKELDEKQQLLCQAVKAMELEEDEHKKDCDSKDKQINELKEQLDTYQQSSEVGSADNDELRSHGDQFSEQKPNCKSDISPEIVKELENKITDLQNQIEELTMNGDIKCAQHTSLINELQNELSKKEEKLDEIMTDLDEKIQELTEANTALESKSLELQEKQTELYNLNKELKQKNHDMQKLQLELNNVKTMYEDKKLLYEQECKKNEKHRIIITSRNNKIFELENTLERYKERAMSMEMKLETAQNEVKSKTKEQQSWSPRKLHNTDVDSFTVRSTPTSADHSSKTPTRLSSTSSRSPNSSKSKSLNDDKALVLYDETISNFSYEELKIELRKCNKKMAEKEKELVKACHIIHKMVEIKHEAEDKINELQKNLQKRDVEIQELNEQLQNLQSVEKKSLQKKISELNLTAATPASETEISAPDVEDPNELVEKYRNLTQQLYIEKQLLKDTLTEKNSQIEILRKEMTEKQNMIVDLQFEVLNYQAIEDKSSEEKDKEIEKLEKELTKRNCDLQGVVNKELWEKNREIEKYAAIFEQKNNEISTLQTQLKVLKEKIAEVENKDIVHEESYMNDRKHLIDEMQSLKNELVQQQKADTNKIAELKENIEKSEQLRLETNHICCALSTRLEELASFLDSLLKQKSVLGLLGGKHHKLREMVNQSLDISRALSFNLSINPDQSLLQLSQISDLLNGSQNESGHLNTSRYDEKGEDSYLSIIPECATLTYHSHLNKSGSRNEENQEIIKVLRQQLEKMKKEIEIRDNELSKCNCKPTSPTRIMHELGHSAKMLLSPDAVLQELMSDKYKVHISGGKRKHRLDFLDNSDSESWSEPDRSISKIRIGLDDTLLRPSRNANPMSESTDDLALLNNNKCRSPSKRISSEMHKQIISQLNETVAELEGKLRAKTEELIVVQANLDSVTNKHKELEAKFLIKTNEYQEMKNNLSFSIQELKQEIVNANERKEQAEQRIVELEETIISVETAKQMLIVNMDAKSKAVQNRINELEVERTSALEASKMAENQLTSTKKELANAQARLKETEMKLKELEVEYTNKIKMIESETNNEIERLNNTALEMKKRYEVEYVKRKDLDRVTKVVEELKAVQDVLQLTQDKVQRLEKSENDLKDKLQETESNYKKKINSLRMELDQATLQYSEAILEKTKSDDQKLQAEFELKSLQANLMLKINEYKKDITALQEKFKKQMSTLENQNSKLQIKNGELESLNADMRQKIIRIQHGKLGEQSHSAPSSPSSPILQMYFAKNNDITNSTGCLSENGLFAYKSSEDSSRHADIERNQANSSPDLGIESDHGRFSSLEANINVARPFQQSLEVSQRMNNMLNSKSEQLDCSNEQCCIKVKDVQAENEQLRRKLMESNKLLESTSTQLALANRRKIAVEKDICKQIYKTSQVLKKAKANLDSGSEVDIRK